MDSTYTVFSSLRISRGHEILDYGEIAFGSINIFVIYKMIK